MKNVIYIFLPILQTLNDDLSTSVVRGKGHFKSSSTHALHKVLENKLHDFIEIVSFYKIVINLISLTPLIRLYNYYT